MGNDCWSFVKLLVMEESFFFLPFFGIVEEE